MTPSRRHWTSDAPSVSDREPLEPTAVLIDGSALYLASSGRQGEGRRLDYQALVDILVKKVPGLRPATEGPSSIWTMWTSADRTNAGQTKFLEFAESRLRWQVRQASPTDSFMVDPASLFGVGAEGAKIGRLLRFDAAIAFAMGRLAETHRLVVVSDSFALHDVMVRVNQHFLGVLREPCVHAFFGTSLDPRWHNRRLRDPSNEPISLDLDEFQSELFGIEGKEAVRGPAMVPGQPIF